jgi:hypothetical protein
MIRLVYSREVACWPWRLRSCGEEPAIGGTCRSCDLDIAVPESRRGDAPICIYCGLDSGLVPAVDEPLA